MANAYASVAERIVESINTGKAAFPETPIIPVTGETVTVSAGEGAMTFRAPFAMKISDVRGSLVTAQTSGSVLTIDINVSGVSILSTKLTFDNTEKTTTTATTPKVLTSNSIEVDDDEEITIDIDQVGDGTAAGLKITLYAVRS